jgi:predicted transcriptional regulator of viral defense system
MQRMQPIEETITLVASRGKISVDDVQKILRLPKDSTRTIVNFLLKFDFIRIVEGKYLVLSDTCTPFFDEIMS